MRYKKQSWRQDSVTRRRRRKKKQQFFCLLFYRLFHFIVIYVCIAHIPLNGYVFVMQNEEHNNDDDDDDKPLTDWKSHLMQFDTCTSNRSRNFIARIMQIYFYCCVPVAVLGAATVHLYISRYMYICSVLCLFILMVAHKSRADNFFFSYFPNSNRNRNSCGNSFGTWSICRVGCFLVCRQTNRSRCVDYYYC